jgi:membrane-associated protein
VLTTILYSLFALDDTLTGLASQYGHWAYALLFVVIFAETGLVVFPFLPGDSILFLSGTIVAAAGLEIHLLVAVLIAAAILGDTVNYAIGHFVGPRVFERPDSRWLRKQHLLRTQRFYEKYGGVTIIIGRFVPIIRTFAPFLAGIAGMSYRRFLSYNVVGAIAWVGALAYAGYLFGNIPLVRDNLTLIVVVFVALSLMPATFTYLRERRARAAGPAKRGVPRA